MENINHRNLILQSKEISFDIEINNIKSLTETIYKDLRNKWSQYVHKAKEMASNLGTDAVFSKKRGRKRMIFYAENSDSELPELIESEEKFKSSVFDTVINKLVTQLESRYQQMKEICNTFRALLNINSKSVDETALEN